MPPRPSKHFRNRASWNDFIFCSRVLPLHRQTTRPLVPSTQFPTDLRLWLASWQWPPPRPTHHLYPISSQLHQRAKEETIFNSSLPRPSLKSNHSIKHLLTRPGSHSLITALYLTKTQGHLDKNPRSSDGNLISEKQQKIKVSHRSFTRTHYSYLWLVISLSIFFTLIDSGANFFFYLCKAA